MSGPSHEEKQQAAALIAQVDSSLLSNLNKDKRDRVLNAVSKVTAINITTQSRSHSGPLPSEDLLRAYDELITDGANRVMVMAETQAAHRQNLETIAVTAQTTQSGRGQFYAFVLSVLYGGAGITAFLTGHETVSGVIFGTTIIGLVTVFLKGKSAQKADLSKKSRDN